MCRNNISCTRVNVKRRYVVRPRAADRKTHKKLEKRLISCENSRFIGPSGEIRTPGILIPNNWWNFLLTFSAPFWHLLFRKSCSLKLSSPLSPCAPNPVMVKYVVKNRFPEIQATFRQIQEAVFFVPL